MRLQHPKANKIEQGAIFTCASVRGYEKCKSWGIVMTARCDLEHNKQSVINYLPIIPFRECLARNLAILIARRSIKETEHELHRALREKGVTDACLSTFPLRRIIEQESVGKQQNVLLSKLEVMELAKALITSDSEPTSETALRLLAKTVKLAEKATEELIKQQLSEYYFLEAVDLHQQPTEGFVILVRHMLTMPTELMRAIASGLAKEDADVVKEASQHLSFQHDPIAMIVGVLRSPDMEHLGQHFASLFVRVGLEDQSEDTVANHRNLIANLGKI